MKKTYSLVDELKGELAEIMLQALKDNGGLDFTSKEYCRLKEQLMNILNVVVP